MTRRSIAYGQPWIHYITFFSYQSKILDFLKCILYSAKMYIHTSMRFENAHINKENPIGKWGNADETTYSGDHGSKRLTNAFDVFD